MIFRVMANNLDNWSEFFFVMAKDLDEALGKFHREYPGYTIKSVSREEVTLIQ
jgi:hypothetical protein